MWLPGRELKGLVEMPRDQKGPRQGELEVESGRRNGEIREEDRSSGLWKPNT